MPKKNSKGKKKVTGHNQRLNQYEIAERRLKVMRLRLSGLSYIAVGKSLGITVAVVRKDLKATAEKNQAKLDSFSQNEVIAEALSTLDEVHCRAWAEFAMSEEGSPHRLKVLDLIRNTTGDRLKALHDCGLIRKETQKVEVEHSIKLDWSEEVQEKVARALLQTTMSSMLAEPELDTHDVIDVEPVESEPVAKPNEVEEELWAGSHET